MVLELTRHGMNKYTETSKTSQEKRNSELENEMGNYFASTHPISKNDYSLRIAL